MPAVFRCSAMRNAPVVAVSDLQHGVSANFTGTGFGTKSPAAPFIRDDMSGTDPFVKWTKIYPDPADGFTTVPGAYRTPAALGLGIALPHSRITKYYCSGNATDFNSGTCYLQYGDIASGLSLPYQIYSSWYQRYRPTWDFVTPGEGANYNFKQWDYTFGPSGYDTSTGNFYGEFRGPDLVDNSSLPGPNINEDYPSTPNGPGAFGGSEFAQNPMAGWVHNEVEINCSSTGTGYIRWYINNLLVLNYTGKTDGWGSLGSGRGFMIGGYTDQYGTAQGSSGTTAGTNYQFLADAYVDRTIQRLVLCNNATQASATICEPQIITAWSNTSITATVNMGALSAGTVYPFVRTTAGAWIALASRTAS